MTESYFLRHTHRTNCTFHSDTNTNTQIKISFSISRAAKTMLHSLQSISGRVSSIFSFSVYLHRWVCPQTMSFLTCISLLFYFYSFISLCFIRVMGLFCSWLFQVFSFLRKIFCFDDENLIINHGDDHDWFPEFVFSNG